MPGMTGMELARKLSRTKNPPLMVFVTAFSNYAVDAFEVDAVDYLLKPFDEADIDRVIERVKSRIGNITRVKPAKYLNKVLAEAGDRLEVIEISQIQLFEAEDRQVYLQTVDDKRYEIRNRLNELEGMLDPANFFRCHRNYIVNINQIAQLANWFHRGYLLIMKNTLREIPVGRVYASRLKEHFPI
jgi:DNA-binding LytR/AlgR family response regulator